MSHEFERRPRLAPTHEPLRVDVGMLGRLLGDVLHDAGGDELLGAVEEARATAIARREEGGAFAPLRVLVAGMPPDDAAALVRAFSTYFSLTNLAEQVHRIRRRRDYQRDESPQPGSLAAVLRGFEPGDRNRVSEALDRLRVMPVFTAHPTEATRRTILKKEQRIARALVDRIQMPGRTPPEDRRIAQRIRTEIGLIWETAEQAGTRPAVADEVEHVLFFLSEIIYRVVPAFHDAVDDAARSVGIERDPHAPPRPMLAFGSWVGGDMDGNPNVGADTIRTTLARHRELILDEYRDEVRALFEHLSQGTTWGGIPAEVRDRADAALREHPDAGVPERYRDMPYRVLLWTIWHRLGATHTGAPGAYRDPDQLADDLTLIDRGLAAVPGPRGGPGLGAGRALVRRLRIRVATFGFHLATLDLRQDALLHRQVVGTLLGDAGFVDAAPEDRTARLDRALSASIPIRVGTGDGGGNGADLDHAATRALEVFVAVGDAITRYGREAIGPYIISMAQGADDVLAVLVLARAGGLVADDGTVPLDVAPLFETVDDLEHAARTFRSMLTHPRYREHLRSRGDRQTVMLGYSDSAKISSLGASRWALYRAQEELLQIAAEHGVDLELFHGRGGTIARGGSRPRAAVLAGPPGATRGRLRTTEQGEIINGSYGLRGIAERTMELGAGAVLEAAVAGERAEPLPAPWRDAMSTVADTSRATWNALVHDDPRFIPYFRAATPVDVIERLAIGSRPASRREGRGVEDLRAIPWVFSWTQSRHNFPGWYGLGAGLRTAESVHGLEVLREMRDRWRFFRNLLADASMTLARADLDVARAYADLTGEEERPVYSTIADAFADTRELVLRILEEDELLDGEPLLQEIIRLRNPYVDPLSLIQVDLLRRWRATDREDAALERVLFNTVRAIARGLRNTG